jgi:tetratricopeptide (TPR) repeat protein
VRTRSQKLLWAVGFLLVGIFFIFSTKVLTAAWEHSDLKIRFVNTAEEAATIGSHYFNVDGSGQYDLDLASRYFKRALALDPAIPGVWHQLSRIDFLNGNFEEALWKINKEITLHGTTSPSSYYVRGLIEGFRKNYPAAETDFKLFLTWKPQSWAAHNDLAWLYFEQGKFKDVEKIAAQGLSYNPGNAWLLLMHGTALMNLGRRTEAKQEFLLARDAAAKLSPADWEKAYPGNDPKIAEAGLEGMQSAIAHNLSLVEN